MKLKRILSVLLMTALLFSISASAVADSSNGNDQRYIDWLFLRQILGLEPVNISEKDRIHIREWLSGEKSIEALDLYGIQSKNRSLADQIRLMEYMNSGGSGMSADEGTEKPHNVNRVPDVWKSSHKYDLTLSQAEHIDNLDFLVGVCCPSDGYDSFTYSDATIWITDVYYAPGDVKSVLKCAICGKEHPNLNCYHIGKYGEGIPKYDPKRNKVYCGWCYAELNCCSQGHALTGWTQQDYREFWNWEYHLDLGYNKDNVEVRKICQTCGYVSEICHHKEVTCIEQPEGKDPVYQCDNCGFTSKKAAVSCGNRDHHTDNYGYVCEYCGYQGSTTAARSCAHDPYMDPVINMMVSNHTFDYTRKVWQCNICGYTLSCAANGHKTQYKGTESAIVEDSGTGGLICGLCGELFDNGGLNMGSSLPEAIGRQSGGTIENDLYGVYEVPAAVLKAAKDKDVTLKLKVDNNFTWTISGKNVDDSKDLSLAVDTSYPSSEAFKDIPEAYLNIAVKALDLTDADIADGAELTMNVGGMYNGQYANVYKIDPATGKAVLADVSLIDEQGNIKVCADESAEYTIIIDVDTKLALDVDNSMKVDSEDAMYLLCQIVGMISCGEKYKADIDGDGKVNVKDVSAILRELKR